MSNASGPFILSLTAHQDIAFACISHLIQALDYVDNDIPRPDLEIRTGLGIFGLQAYANEHWIHHLLEMFKDGIPLPSRTRDSVSRRALQLCAKHSQLKQSHNTTPSAHFQEGPSIDLDLRLSRLDPMPEIQHLIRQVLYFRKRLEDQQSKNGLGR